MVLFALQPAELSAGDPETVALVPIRTLPSAGKMEEPSRGCHRLGPSHKSQPRKAPSPANPGRKVPGSLLAS